MSTPAVSPERVKLPGTEGTWVELLRWRAEHEPDRLSHTFVGGSTEREELTYAVLDQRARAVAARLQGLGLEGGSVLLLYPPGAEYLAAFFGCLYAGAIPVPAYPPDPARLHRSLPRFRALVADAQPRVAMGTSFVVEMSRALAAEELGVELTWLATDDLSPREAERWREPGVRPDDLALLQYTSGSTSAPKGVMLTHRNLLANSRAIQATFGTTRDSRGVIWLPFYHDMGLIGGILQPLYAGFPVTLMSPLDMLQSPLRWLELISSERATISGGPNFAFDLCVRKTTPEQRAALDLSTWKVAFNGADTVRPETLKRFAEAFAVSGFHPAAFLSCYGLAEATLIVSGAPHGTGARVERFEREPLEKGCALPPASTSDDVAALVSCGPVVPEHEVLIVDPRSRVRAAPGAVGEIWVRGPSVAQGYWKNPEATERTFLARCADAPEQGPFLRTGDLGFVAHGELFVNGRLKDLIIVRGRNVYPQDIELVAEGSHPAVRRGSSAAFSRIEDGVEQLCLVCEVDARRMESAEAVVSAITDAVAEAHDLQPHTVALVGPGAVPKTSSGKVQRSACKEALLEGTLETLHQSQKTAVESGPAPGFPARAELLALTGDARRARLEDALRDRLAHAARTSPASVQPARALAALGVDSLAAVELAHTLERELGVVLPVSALLGGATLSTLAADIASALEVSPTASPAPSEPGQLSAGQQGLWFLQQLEPTSAAYNVALALRVPGHTNREALVESVGQLAARHPILRTRYARTANGPRMQVEAAAAPEVVVEDSRGLSEAGLQERLREVALRPFALETDPILRAHLHVREEALVLLLVTHHIAVDFWSLVILLRELGELYAAAVEKRAPGLPPPGASHDTFVAWQQEALAGTIGERGWEHWLRVLGEGVPALELPTDHPRPASLRHRGASIPFALEGALAERIREIARANACTPFAVLLTAFQLVLARFSGQEVVAVGTPAAGRVRAAFDRTVGFFANTLVIRTELGGAPLFTDVLRRVRDSVVSGLEHQAIPFSKLVERLQPMRDPSRSPLVQATFALEKSHVRGLDALPLLAMRVPGARASLGALEVESYPLAEEVAPFEVNCFLAETATGFSGTLQYDVELFERSSATAWVEHFRQVVEAVAADAGRPLSALAPTSPAESGAVAPSPIPTHGRTFVDLFHARSDLTPDAVALETPEVQWSYRELDARSSRLARHLQELGAGPETPVGVCLPRGADAVVSFLAIMKAGAVYLPMDLRFPDERLRFLASDAQPVLVLVAPERASAFAGLDTRVLMMAEVLRGAERHPPERMPCPATPENGGCILYTSGSTGKPKGVVLGHAGLANWAVNNVGDARPRAGARILQFAAPVFDAAVSELVIAFSCGATLCVPPVDAQLPGPALVRFLQASRVTDGLFPPSTLATLSADAVPHLRTVCSAGEVLPPEVVARWSPGRTLLNVYGPTECTVIATVQHCTSSDGGWRVPIGKPVAGAELYLLDPALHPVPRGAAGEVYIGGPGVGLRYLNRPELTGESFVPSPFGPPGSRLYRTGDRARLLPDGSFDFLGRLDHQVKVRGFRIDLGEIESTLRALPEVEEAAVLAPNRGSDGVLVACLTRKAGTPGDTDALRRQLEQALPSYMVPHLWVELARMPRTATGKLDRAALPAPQTATAAGDWTPPQGPLQESLARIFSEVLGAGRVGAHDDFFALGGHSLLATQVASRVEAAHATTLSVRELFEHPTVASLAAILQGRIANAAGALSAWKPSTPSLDDVETMSEAELDALLTDLASPKETT